MPALREIFAEYDVVFDRQRNLQRGNRQVTQLRSVLQRLRPTVASATAALAGMATAAGAGAAAGLQRIVSSTVESTREIERWSGRLSISSGALRSWIELGREYGASVDDVTDALKELQLKAQDAISGGTAQAEMFERIGISIAELRPVVNDADALMALFTTRLNRVNDVALRNFTVDELMSDAGTRLNQVFALGTEEIARRRAALTRSMGPMEGLTRAVADHVRNVIQMSRRWERFKREITARVLPILGEISRKLLEFEEPARRVIRSILDIIQNTHLLRGALIGVGVVAAIAAAATIGTWGPIAAMMVGISAAVAGVAAAYAQVSATIEGSNTALREWLDNEQRLGAGGTEGLLLLISDRWENIKQNISNATAALQEFAAGFGPTIEVLRWIWRFLEFVQGVGGVAGVIREQILPEGVWGTLRGAAQERVQEEREREAQERDRIAEERGRSATNRAIAEEETRAYGGVATDAGGYQMSVPDQPARRERPLEDREDVVRFAPGELERIRTAPAERLPEVPSIRRVPDVMPIMARTAGLSETIIPRAERALQQAVSIDAPMTMNLSVAEATDAQEVGRIVTDRVRTEMRGQVAQLESLVSDQTEVGS